MVLEGGAAAATIAEVAVSRPVGRLLSYEVPDHLIDAAIPGTRALVPLGSSEATGLILGLRPKRSEEANKPLIELLDESPILDQSLLEMLRFTISWYRAEPSAVIRCALPAGLGIDSVRSLLKVDDRDLPFDLAHLNTRLKSGVPVAAKAFTEAEVRHLLRSGAVTEERRLKSKKEPQIEWLRALVHPDEVGARAPAQRALMNTLFAAGDWVCIAELRGVTGLRRLINQLRQRDAIERRFTSWVEPPVGLTSTIPELSGEQRRAVDAIDLGGGFAQHLLFGVTGSGKTEVYLRLIEALLQRGDQALVMVPEIALTPQMVARFSARFGDRIAVMHSALPPGRRRSAWHRARRGEAAVIIGARSAVFASLPRLGLVVVDEEHDGSYKQSDGVRYNGRDLAILRAKAADVPIVLGSATPSLESYHRACTGEHNTYLHRLESRPTGAAMPVVHMVDLRRPSGSKSKPAYPLSDPLRLAIENTLARGEQTMLLLNRRGWAPALLCLDCGLRHSCPDCSVAMVLHRRGGSICHWCGRREEPPRRCKDCGSSAMIDAGIGTQQLEAACIEAFATARVERLDSDTARSQRRLEAILQRMAEASIDILVGTQMLAKGHDLPGVTLVGVICADQGLRMPDPRAAERTFALLSQVAGRAGRAGRPGRAIFQTFDPQHPAIACAAAHDAIGFYEGELKRRRQLRLPPFQRAALIRCAHPDRHLAEEAATAFAAQRAQGVENLGPTPAVIERVRGDFRIQALALSKTARSLQAWLDKIEPIRRAWQKRGVKVVVDVDPMELL
jgi:primosomal protein N' (replication factor Y)